MDGMEYALIIGIIACIIEIIRITIVDRIDYHYSKKRGEIK